MSAGKEASETESLSGADVLEDLESLVATATATIAEDIAPGTLCSAEP